MLKTKENNLLNFVPHLFFLHGIQFRSYLMRDDVRDNLDEQRIKPTAREILLSLSQTMPLGERLEPMFGELLWILHGKQNEPEHQFIFPPYCYNILDKARRTIFQALPSLDEMVFCPDPSKLAGVKSYEEAKEFIRFDWYLFGKMIGVLLRMIRFVNVEMEGQIKKDGLWELEADKELDVISIFGQNWLENKGLQSPGNLPGAIVSSYKETLPVEDFQQKWSRVACEFGPEAMSDFNRGIADGIEEFIDPAGELVGEKPVANNYLFFLILWPEIKTRLGQSPVPNRTEVFEWIKPLHEAGCICIPDIDYFHNFCESIGLKFAGRIPKKP